MDAFDADVLIYAAVSGHELGQRVRALFPAEPLEDSRAGLGLVLLLPELLTKPLREGADDEFNEVVALLGRLDLRPTDEATAEMATALGASYGLEPPTLCTSPQRSAPARTASSPTTDQTSQSPSQKSKSPIPTSWPRRVTDDRRFRFSELQRGSNDIISYFDLKKGL